MIRHRCRVCGRVARRRDLSPRGIHKGQCARDAVARANAQIKAKRGPAYEKWRRAVMFGVESR